MRGGSIIPMQEPALTTHATRNNSFSLLVALDDQQNANGDLFWDDGESTNITQYVRKHYSVLLCVCVYELVSAMHSSSCSSNTAYICRSIVQQLLHSRIT